MDKIIENELIGMIVDAETVKKETSENEIYKKEMAKAIKYQNERIQEAKEKGLTSAYFGASSEYKDDLKQLYHQKGYRFKPTGYIGGVWQQTEDICWT